jgi:hypothetical protein
MDLDRLSNGEKIAGVSAIVLFIFMFFDWFSVEVSAGAGSFAVGSGGGSAWDALDFIPIILVIAIIAALGIVVLRLVDTPYEVTPTANAIVAILGAISFLLILYRIVDTPGGGSAGGISVDVSPAFGIFVSLVAAAGMAYGGYKAMQEEGGSFSEIGDRFSGGGAGSTGHAPHAHQPPAAPPQQPPAPQAQPQQPPAQEPPAPPSAQTPPQPPPPPPAQ